jgi:hypothetical protein
MIQEESIHPPHDSCRRAGRAALYVVLGLLAVALLVILVLPEPWKSKAGRRLAAGKTLKVAQYVELGVWWAALGNALLAALLAATWKWWRGIFSPIQTPEVARPRINFAILGLILIVASVIRIPFLDDTMRRDESDTLVRSIRGAWFADGEGAPVFKQVSWTETLWEDLGGNNPMLFSVLARVCDDLRAYLTSSEPGYFSPSAIRLPSLIAGVLTCGALYWLGGLMGIPKPGAFAAFVLALHPWHIRYSTEGRGYALCTFLCVLAAGFLLLAFRERRWKWFWAYGVSQFLMLYSYPGSIYVALALFAGGVIFVLRQSRDLRFPLLGRLAVPCILTGCLYAYLVSPCVPQIVRYIDRPSAKGSMDGSWGLEALGNFAAGIGLGKYDGDPPPEFGRLYDVSRPSGDVGVIAFVLMMAPLAAAGGAWVAWRKIWQGALFAFLVIGAAALAFLHNKYTGFYLYPWYLIYALPFVTLLMACGTVGWPFGKRGSVVMAVLFLAGFVLSSIDSWKRLPRKQREYVEFGRGSKLDRVYRDGRVIRYNASAMDAGASTNWSSDQ